MELVNKMELLKQLADKLNNSHWYSETEEGFEAAMSMLEEAPTVDAIPIEWIENFTNNYCDLVAAIDTQFFINEFILKRWRAESEGKDWPQVKNNAEKNYQYLKKLLREGETLEAAKFVEEKENEIN